MKRSTLPPDWDGRVWAMVELIPEGKVSTYGQLAGLLGFPRHARHIGKALSRTPEERDLPWHRVVNARGESSLPLHSQAWHVQMALLVAESVLPDENGRINLKIYGWTV